MARAYDLAKRATDGSESERMGAAHHFSAYGKVAKLTVN
jgi:hypothetical protein